MSFPIEEAGVVTHQDREDSAPTSSSSTPAARAAACHCLAAVGTALVAAGGFWGRCCRRSRRLPICWRRHRGAMAELGPRAAGGRAALTVHWVGHVVVGQPW